jgi:hypothetical protein
MLRSLSTSTRQDCRVVGRGVSDVYMDNRSAAGVSWIWCCYLELPSPCTSSWLHVLRTVISFAAARGGRT